MANSPIVLLDRDGTINVDYGYVCRVEDAVLVPGAAQAIGNLNRAGAKVFVITNQSAVGRGLCRAEDVDAVNTRIRELLVCGDRDAKLQGIFCCLHRPEDLCACRKPSTGLLQELQAVCEFFPAAAWMVGDKESDIAFGIAAGIEASRCILLGQGGESGGAKKSEQGYLVCNSLLEASEVIRKALASGSDKRI